MKCRICEVKLTIENAYVNRTKGTFQTACKECGRNIAKKWHADNKERELERRKKYYQENKEVITAQIDASRIRRKYGISKEQVEEMSKAQNGCCAICNQKKKMVIDHCHTTGRVRGLLCNGCNTAIGMMGENIEAFQAAIKYLEQT
ncbi:endonuclease VII [Xanthomonas phage JGB6]|nr:endonuclease VII [Xanthomonas phage JGB6]